MLDSQTKKETHHERQRRAPNSGDCLAGRLGREDMKVTTRTFLAYGEQGIELSKAERETLRRASAIAEQARELARQLAPEWEDDPLDVTLAHVEHDGAELAEAGFVPVVEVAGAWLVVSNPQPAHTTARKAGWECTLTVQVRVYSVTDPASIYKGMWLLVRSDGAESGYLDGELVAGQLVEWGVAPEDARGPWNDEGDAP